MSTLDTSSTSQLIGPGYLAAASRDGTRPNYQDVLQSIKRAVDASDWRTIVSISRKMFANMGIPRGAITLKAMLSVGEAWDPAYLGEDVEWGKEARAWLVDYFYPMYNVRGPLFDFKTDRYLDSLHIDHSGDVFYLLTASDSGFPMVQSIPNYLVRTPFGVAQNAQGVQITLQVPRHLVASLKDDPTDGPVTRTLTAATVSNGVAYNLYGRAFAYCVFEEATEFYRSDAVKFRWVHEQYMIHTFDPEYIEQGRGFPCFTHAVRTFISMLCSQEFEEITHMIMSSISLEEHNETGTAPIDPTMSIGTKTLAENLAAATSGEDIPEVVIEKIIGGAMRYFKSNTGATIKTPARTSPGPVWDAFQDRLTRIALVGANMPPSVVWKGNEDNGTSNRVSLEKLHRTIIDRQSLLSYAGVRIIRYGLAYAMKTNRLRKSADWWSWGFSLPPEFTIDDGRIAQSNREDYVMGHQNLTGILARQGKTLVPHLNERAEEEAQKQLAAKRVTEKYKSEGVLVLPDMLGTSRTSATVGGGKTDPKGEDDPAPGQDGPNEDDPEQQD